MLALYVILAAVHLVAVAVTGAMWTYVDLVTGTRLRRHLRDIRAVHFGSLYLVPILLGLGLTFERLRVPDGHQAVVPVGLAALLILASIGYLFPTPPELDPFYYWTRGPARVLALAGLTCLAGALVWTAAVLTVYVLQSPTAGLARP